MCTSVFSNEDGKSQLVFGAFLISPASISLRNANLQAFCGDDARPLTMKGSETCEYVYEIWYSCFFAI